MKKNFMLLVAMMMSTVIFAQHHKGDGKRHDQSETMKSVLSLDDNQYATIKSINTKYHDKGASLRKDSLQARDQKHIAVKALRQEREQEIQAVLTPEQNAKWKTYKTEQAAKRKEERQKSIENYQSEMKTSLSLSDDQFEKMKTVNSQFREKLHAAKKEGKGDKTEFKKLKVEHETAVKGILTEQQFQKWTTLKTEKRKQHKGRYKHK